jgi:hypothetical protein
MRIDSRLVTALLALVAALGCTSVVVAECRKRAECGGLGSQTYEECVQESQESMDTVRRKNDPICTDYITATERYYACRSTKTCAQLEDSATCRTEGQDLAGEAFTAAVHGCFN